MKGSVGKGNAGVGTLPKGVKNKRSLPTSAETPAQNTSSIFEGDRFLSREEVWGKEKGEIKTRENKECEVKV